MRIALIVIGATLYSAVAAGKLPPPSDAAKATAAQAAAKGAWSDKVSAFQTCRAMDRTAEAYRRDQKSAGKDAPAAAPTPPCTDPGPYAPPAAPTPVENKPIEAAGAHSPAGNATSPPSTTTPAAAMPAGKK